MKYIISQDKSFRRLSPEEEKEAQKLAALSLKVKYRPQPESLAKMTKRERAETERLSTILHTMRLVEESKDQELATEKERLATERRQLRNVAENVTKTLAGETPPATRESIREKTLDEKPPEGESPVRIETAIGELQISHSRVKQAARDKEICSQQPGGKRNSPYLVYKSQVQKKFSPHGSK